MEEFINVKEMTLRDWFAGQALAGYMAHPKHDRIHSPNSTQALVRAAYLQADAMLFQRDQPTQSLEKLMKEEDKMIELQAVRQERKQLEKCRAAAERFRQENKYRYGYDLT
jgi:hypothetical protein